MTAFSITANLAFDSKQELIDAINDWMDREDLSGAAPQMIALCEDEIRIAIEELLLETSATLQSDNNGLASLPADAKTVKRVIHNGCTIPQRGINAIDRMPEDKTQPLAYTLEQSSIRLWPLGEYTVDILYQPLLSRLTEANPSNSLLDLFPSLYFYGSLTFASGYVADDMRAAQFRSLFDLMLEKVRSYFINQRNAGQLAARVDFVP